MAIGREVAISYTISRDVARSWAGLMVTPAVLFASGEPPRAADVTAALAQAAMGSGWHCTRADSQGGRSECRERPTR
jgi:hypothetical protein